MLEAMFEWKPNILMNKEKNSNGCKNSRISEKLSHRKVKQLNAF